MADPDVVIKKDCFCGNVECGISLPAGSLRCWKCGSVNVQEFVTSELGPVITAADVFPDLPPIMGERGACKF